MKELDIFVKRLEKIGIRIELVSNYPWVYLYKINGVIVTEKFSANHGFTITFLPIKYGEKMKFLDLKEMFKLIRKYIEK